MSAVAVSGSAMHRDLDWLFAPSGSLRLDPPTEYQSSGVYGTAISLPAPDSFKLSPPLKEWGSEAPAPTPPYTPLRPFKHASVFSDVDRHAVEVSARNLRSSAYNNISMVG